MRKHAVKYFKCNDCGFIQTEHPFWLKDAYSSALASQDVGVMQRNLANREITSAVLNLILPNVRSAVDFGAGHGVFVRLMRDRGFNFFWSDIYATNDYARGFEATSAMSFDFLTAFEVLEHLVDPIDEISKMMARADAVMTSTSLVPYPAPQLSDWWYYMPSSGQHVSFYTPDSLRVIAKLFNRHVISGGEYHLFTREPVSPVLYRIATSPKMARVANKVFQRSSLIASDFQQMTGS